MKRIAGVVSTICIVGCLFSSASYATDSADVERENRLKAAVIFNFMKFVEWPKGAADNGFVLCFNESDSLAYAMDVAVVGKNISGQTISVKKVERNATTGCHVFYSDNEDVLQRLPLLDNVLTISSKKMGVSKNGLIFLYIEANKLRFAVNTDNLKKSHLVASSELLKLAKLVERGGL